MELRYKSNLVAGIVSTVMGIVLFIIIPSQIKFEPESTYGMTSRTVPYLVAIIFVICGIGLIIQSLVLKQDEVKKLVLKKELNIGIYIVTLVLYLFLFKKSFLISTSILGVITLALTGSKKKLFYAITLITVVLIYVVFTQLLHVRLP